MFYGGPAVADYEINQQVQADLPRAGEISGPILLILLLLIFRSAVAALLPLLIGGVSVLGAFALTRFLAHYLEISVFASNIIGLLGLGLAIDYSLLFVSRFRDELAAGKSIAGCLERTIKTAGESIFFSGCTVTISLLGMLAFPESFLRSMGIGGALAVSCAMAASLTVLPAILAVIGPWVNKGAIPLPGRRRQPQMDTQGFWFRFSHWVMRRALWVIPVTLALLLAGGIPFLHVRFANSGPDSLPATFQTRLTSDLLTRDFAISQSAPMENCRDHGRVAAHSHSVDQPFGLYRSHQAPARCPECQQPGDPGQAHSALGVSVFSMPTCPAPSRRMPAPGLRVEIPRFW